MKFFTNFLKLQAIALFIFSGTASTQSLKICPHFITPTCNNSSDGSIWLNVYGGSNSFSYLWSNGSTTRTIKNLRVGTYTVTVTDRVSNYQESKSVTISKSKVGATFTKVKASCFGLCDASITAAGTGGNGGPYTYLWNNGSTSATISGICANIYYTVTITDKLGCTFSCAQKVGQPLPLAATASAVNVVCENDCNGSATAIPTGGTPPYSYLWSEGQSTKTATGLCRNSYMVTVTDSKGCTANTDAVINSSQSFGVSVFNAEPYDCYCNGYLELTPSVGQPQDYTYLWSTGATTANIYDLCEGGYEVTVTNSSGCVYYDGYTLYNHNTSFVAVGCFVLNDESAPGASDGSIEAVIAHGWSLGPFNYIWSNGQTTSTLTGLTAGIYTVTVTAQSSNCAAVSSSCEVITLSQRLNNAGSVNENVELYPNPFTEVLKVDLSTDESLNIVMRDMEGRTVVFYEKVNASFNVAPKINPGIYYLQIENESGTYNRIFKVIKSE